MARIISEERVLEYTREFKVMVVQLTQGLDVKATEISEILDLHPMMVYRWRQEYREGKLDYEQTRKVSMTKKYTPSPADKSAKKKLEKVKKENAKLKKEVALLKKWQRYLTDLKQSDSPS